ncbi:MAG: family 43 glycosylhydrolase [Clostridia bacterium]|nr:family 43 glycosylhydrolase [Clostridia bacterium]
MPNKYLENTYCNPIVLPDYPNLKVISKGGGFLSGNWGREGKEFVSERQLAWEAAGNTGPMPKPDLSMFGDRTFVREAENDVRATADPSCMYYEGRWYLYCTSGMVYDSDDFIHWTPHYDETWLPISEPMAPTVEAFRGKFYATANSVPLHVSDSPLGPWKRVGEWVLPDGREMLANDPMIFRDDDDRLYLYWGLGTGIFGAELDPEKPNHLITHPKHLFDFDGNHAWERMGTNNENWGMGCMEGSWMYKKNGVYYLIYSVCGTEYYSYCMGAYVCDSPLGDFVLQKKNPVSRSDRGLIRGGGHGSIVDGPNGTIWCFYTIPVSIDHLFERRIGIDPVGIDEEGNLYALTGCDVPQYGPGVKADPEKGNAVGIGSCSSFTVTKASSYEKGHRPMYAIDEVLHTWWQPTEGDAEPWFALSLRSDYFISAVRLMWKDAGLNFDKGVKPGPYKYVIEGASANGDWFTLVDASENDVDLSVDYRTFDEVRINKMRIRILSWPEGVTPGIMNFTAFGEHSARREKWGHKPILG